MRRIVGISLLAVGLLIALRPGFAPAALINLGAGASAGCASDGSAVAFNTAAGASLWTATNGAVALGGTSSTAAGVAARNGQFIVAGSNAGKVSLWQGDADGVGSWTRLPESPWTAMAVAASAGNAWVVGRTDGYPGTRNAIRYKSSSNTTAILSLPAGGSPDSVFAAVSDTGIFAGTFEVGGQTPAGWPQAMAGWPLVALRPLAGASSMANQSGGLAISDNGLTAGGWSTSTTSTHQATLWNISSPNQPIAIPMLPGCDRSELRAINGDGAFAAGAAWSSADPDGTVRAFVWDATTGTRELSLFLSAEKGLDTTGWLFTSVCGISTDGRFLTGDGVYGGETHVWAAAVHAPEPATLALLGVGMAVMTLRPRRCRTGFAACR